MTHTKKDYKYIYGPVFSWRLGKSIGIDPVSTGRKICSFDCVYCQVGRTKVFSDRRKVYIPTAEIIKELVSLPAVEADYITFSGAGEPTLAENLGELIKEVKKIRKESIAVLTNSSLIHKKDVQEDLSLADLVVAKLDACSQDVLVKIDRPMREIRFLDIVKGIKKFRAGYKGRLALQIMFVSKNKKYVDEISWIAREMEPDEIQLNTPLRPCGIKPMSRADMDVIKLCFLRHCGRDTKIISVYDIDKEQVTPFSARHTLMRRGKV